MATKEQIKQTILAIAGNPSVGEIYSLAEKWADAIWKIDNKDVAVKEVPNEPETVVWDDVETKAFEDTGTFIADLQAQLGASIEGFKCAHGDMLRKEGTSKAGKRARGQRPGVRARGCRHGEPVMNWVIRENGTAIGVGSAADIVVGRLEYLVEKKPDNPRRLIAEALDYARALRGWIKAVL